MEEQSVTMTLHGRVYFITCWHVHVNDHPMLGFTGLQGSLFRTLNEL